MNLKIGGIVYKVLFVPELEGCGELDRGSNEVKILSTLSKEQQSVTLWHEILHAINGELGEQVTESLAQQLYQFFKDNNLDFEQQEKEPKCLNRKKKSLKSRSPKKR